MVGMRIPGPKTDPLLSSMIRQALFKCEMPQLELKSLRRFLELSNVLRGQMVKRY